ncbi:MAG: DUF2975 domain-containing protein [Bacteroidales bacterium]|jgi:hypothetical protein|nr:DUF2975 domain-containing protein [Bacteroidales bacterium]
MKKKLNFFCVLMLLLMVAQVVTTFVMGADAFQEGWQKGASDQATSGWTALIGFLFGIAVILAAIVSFVCFLRFILNVNQNNVLTGENVNLLRLTGIGLLIITVFVLCSTLWEGENFAVAFDETIGLMIFSVFNLIVAEAFAIGLKLKEEQELTI